MRRTSSRSTFAMILVVFLISVSCTPRVRSVESPATGWSKTYGGVSYEHAYCLVQTSHGYALAGLTESYGAGYEDFWLVETDLFGNAQWNKTYGGAGRDEARALVETSDGGYALAGTTFSYGAGNGDFWLVRTDSLGNHLWNKTYGGEYGDYCYALIETKDEGYALAGYSNSPYGDFSDFDFWLIKTDKLGNMQWNKTYGGSKMESLYCIVETMNGGYVMVGSTKSFGAGQDDIWLVRTDDYGNMQWNRTYGGSGWDRARSVVQTIDGGYAIGGYSNSFSGETTPDFGHDFWLIKTDSSGIMNWTRTYGGTDTEYVRSAIQTRDGGYALVGEIDFTDLLFVRTDANGNRNWSRVYGGYSSDIGEALVETGDGGYALAGYTGSFGAGMGDFWLIKTGSDGIIPEFPLSLVLLLFMMVTLLAVIVYGRKHVKTWESLEARRTKIGVLRVTSPLEIGFESHPSHSYVELWMLLGMLYR